MNKKRKIKTRLSPQPSQRNKATLAALVAALLVFILSISGVIAGGTGVELSDLMLRVEIPETWTVLTRDLAEDNEAFTTLGITKEAWMEAAEDSGTYLSAVSQDLQSELIISMESSKDIKKAYDLNLLNEEQLREFEQETYDLRQLTGKTITTFQRAYHKQAAFIMIEDTQEFNRGTAYSKDYITIINGQAITFSMKSFAGEIEGDTAEALSYVMGSLVFTEVTEKPKFDFDSMLLGMAGVLIFAAFALVFRIRINRKKGKTTDRTSEKIGGFRNKYTRW